LLPIRRRQESEDIHPDESKSSDPLAEFFIEQFTKPGDIVFDPFAGFGTYLLAAEKLGRIPFGIEADEERFNYAYANLRMKDNIIHGDSRRLKTYQIPKLDFVFTSPTFMYSDETMNPLSGFKEEGTYQDYLDEIQNIFRQVESLLNPGAKVVVAVFNLGPNDSQPLTLLAWDMTRSISEVLHFEKEIVVCLHEDETIQGESIQKYGYNHFYCLIFRK
jgi:tRNA G10  N-methylase Trm11